MWKIKWELLRQAIIRYNDEVNLYLEELHGPDWLERYGAEVAKACKLILSGE